MYNQFKSITTVILISMMIVGFFDHTIATKTAHSSSDPGSTFWDEWGDCVRECFKDWFPGNSLIDPCFTGASGGITLVGSLIGCAIGCAGAAAATGGICAPTVPGCTAGCFAVSIAACAGVSVAYAALATAGCSVGCLVSCSL
jgi:hypothetical protein